MLTFHVSHGDIRTIGIGIANVCHPSDQMGAYVHELTLATSLRDLISDPEESPDAASTGLSGIPGDRCPVLQEMVELHTREPCDLDWCHMCPIAPEQVAFSFVCAVAEGTAGGI